MTRTLNLEEIWRIIAPKWENAFTKYNGRQRFRDDPSRWPVYLIVTTSNINEKGIDTADRVLKFQLSS